MVPKDVAGAVRQGTYVRVAGGGAPYVTVFLNDRSGCLDRTNNPKTRYLVPGDLVEVTGVWTNFYIPVRINGGVTGHMMEYNFYRPYMVYLG